MNSDGFTKTIAPVLQHLPIGAIKKNIIQCKVEATQDVRKVISSPYKCVINITNTCNYRCKFCEIHHIHKLFPQHYSNTLDLSTFKRLNPILKNLFLLDFYGNVGEPLMNPDLMKLVRHVKHSFGSRIFLNTNGSLLDASMSSALISEQLDEILVSLHAATEATYSKLLGGDFKQVTDNIATMTTTKEYYSVKKPEVGIAFALNQLNANETEEIVNLTQKLKADYLQVSHYYHGQNAFEEDISFRNQSVCGNAKIDSLYSYARLLSHIKRKEITVLPKERPYLGTASCDTPQRCFEPWSTIKMEGCPEHKDSHYISVCNRIMLLRLNYTEFDFTRFHDTLWNHPYLQYMRATVNFGERNPICQFCKNPETPSIRNTDNEGYRNRRDEAMRSFWEQAEKSYPAQNVKGLYKLTENPY